ncbi:hypothetical protein HB912_12350 [Listeria aquatica]|uniref:Uncharacterized protein n=1 Tax=Listeria aquatica TaxID=1494960 RepID=A0A841ZP62_9LIST|nr:hypothetical protein [Listeria aquatica]MBC1522439.1 hypothetical protein [Listeria aquatica]
MNRVELSMFEYAVFVFNELVSSQQRNDFKPFTIIWKSNVGFVTARTVYYKNDLYPVLNQTIKSDFITYDLFKPEKEKYDVFSMVRHTVYDYFDATYSPERFSIIDRPDILMEKLVELSKIEYDSNVLTPSYSTVWNVETIDAKLSFPFIDNNILQITQPVTLISKN